MVSNTRETTAGDDRQRLSSVIADLNNVNQRLERLYDALETGELTLADLAPRIQPLRQQQELLSAARIELENRLSDTRVELADMDTVKDCVKILKYLLDVSDISERKSFVRSFIKAVSLKGVEVSLEYTPELLTGMKTEETFRVPVIIQNGGRYWI